MVYAARGGFEKKPVQAGGGIGAVNPDIADFHALVAVLRLFSAAVVFVLRAVGVTATTTTAIVIVLGAVRTAFSALVLVVSFVLSLFVRLMYRRAARRCRPKPNFEHVHGFFIDRLDLLRCAVRVVFDVIRQVLADTLGVNFRNVL